MPPKIFRRTRDPTPLTPQYVSPRQLGEPYYTAVWGSGGGSLRGMLWCIDRLGFMVDPSSRGFGLHAGIETSFHLHAVTIPTMRGRWRKFQLLSDRLVWLWTLSSLLSATPRPSPRARGHGADGLGRRLVPLLAQHSIRPVLREPHCLVHSSCFTLVVGEGPRLLGVERRTFLCSSSILSLLKIGEHIRLAYAPQMLPSLMEVSNSVEDQTV